MTTTYDLYAKCQKLESELAEYHTLESENRLLKLPCILGSKVYRIFRVPANAPHCPSCNTACTSELVGIGTCHYWDETTGHCNCPVAIVDTDTVKCGIFVDNFKLDMYFEYGRTVFTDPKEAEEAVKVLAQSWDALYKWCQLPHLNASIQMGLVGDQPSGNAHTSLVD